MEKGKIFAVDRREMYILSDTKFKEIAAPALGRIFAREDPWKPVFASHVEVRRLLYPVFFTLDYMSDNDAEVSLLDAIVSSATRIGDEGFFLSILERSTPSTQKTPWHWYIPFTRLDIYHSLSLPFVLEHALYSPNGDWGIMISHEEHALLGASTPFFDALCEAVPGINSLKQVKHFLVDWKRHHIEYGADIAWIPNFLTHIYGSKTAEQLLSDADFVVPVNNNA